MIAVFVYYYEVHRALRLQLADQLGARKHVPDVRHAVHDRPAPTRTAKTSTCASTSSIRKFSPRGKAIADIVTSVFFFIFIGTMLVDRLRASPPTPSPIGEHSFTEWGIQYWPVKLDDPDRRRADAAAGHLAS